MCDNIKKCLDEYTILPKDETNKYFFKGRSVPRVTEILSKMIHEDYLMNWANMLGLVKRIKLSDEMNRVSTIGTYSHNTIEEYIKHDIFNKEELEKELNNENIYNAVENCVESFKLWYDDISNNNIEIVGIENKLVCPWYGGTYDLLIKINDVLYLVDFKTSNHIGYKYMIQLSAYKYVLNMNNINIGGCIILQLDKKKPSFEEYFLNFNILSHKQFIDQCTNTFLSLVYAYYNIVSTENSFNKIFRRG